MSQVMLFPWLFLVCQQYDFEEISLRWSEDLVQASELLLTVEGLHYDSDEQVEEQKGDYEEEQNHEDRSLVSIEPLLLHVIRFLRIY